MTNSLYTIFSDGGSRGNPGPAAIGAVIEQDGRVIHTISRRIGEGTNNQAEYQALHAALMYVQERGGTSVRCYLDSELVVHQLNGKYKMKNPDLAVWFAKIKVIANAIGRVTYTAIPREKNGRADALVNQALDAR